MLGILLGILSLGIIILIHEFGHFVFFFFFGVGVLEFSLGMGPRLITFIRNNTRYSIKALPLGGSCAMLGEDAAGSGDFTDFGGVTNKEDGTVDFDGVVYKLSEIPEKSLNKKSPIQKIIITFAGPLFNFLLAIILIIPIIYNTGVDIPIVKTVAEESAASEAIPYALEEGDIITGMEISNDKLQIDFFREISMFMQIHAKDFEQKDELLLISFRRNNENLQTLLKPKYDEEYGRSLIGISFSNEPTKAANFFELIKFSIKEFKMNVKTVIAGLRMLISGSVSVNEMSGPVGTVAIMGETIEVAKKFSILSMLFTIAELIIMISVNLGIMNLLPIPALDGGRILLYAIEMIMGKPVDQKVEAAVNGAGMVFLLLLMALVLGSDIIRLFKI